MNIIFSQERMPGKHIVDQMKKAGKRCLEEEGAYEKNVQASVTFVDEEEIHLLNREHRGVDKVTDVLSFPQFENLQALKDELIKNQEEVCIGDIVICTEQALLQADDFGHSPEREIVYLFVHSMLHLLGYDHMEDEDKSIMREKEENIMKKLGLERD